MKSLNRRATRDRIIEFGFYLGSGYIYLADNVVCNFNRNNQWRILA